MAATEKTGLSRGKYLTKTSTWQLMTFGAADQPAF